MKTKRSFWIILFMVILLLSVSIFSLFVGTVKNADYIILWEIRFPRILLGGLVGMALATAGALLQGLLRNPLADPFIIGTSGGAMVGTLIGFQLREIFPDQFTLSTIAFYLPAFLGSLLATVSAYLVARTERQVPIVNLLLAGTILSSLCGALVLLFFTLQHKESFTMFFFLMGNLMEGNMKLIGISGSVILFGLGLSIFTAKGLNILALGEEKAKHLGIEVEKFKFFIFILSSLIVSAAVSISGIIGFVGLIVPHLARLLIGPNHKVLLPVSALAGGTLLVITDALARTIASPIEIPVGVITALLGAPFFLYLLRRKRKEHYF